MENIILGSLIALLLLTVYIITEIKLIQNFNEKFKENIDTGIKRFSDALKQSNKELFESMMKAKSYRPRRQDFNNHASAWRKKGNKEWNRTGREDKKLDTYDDLGKDLFEEQVKTGIKAEDSDIVKLAKEVL